MLLSFWFGIVVPSFYAWILEHCILQVRCGVHEFALLMFSVHSSELIGTTSSGTIGIVKLPPRIPARLLTNNQGSFLRYSVGLDLRLLYENLYTLHMFSGARALEHLLIVARDEYVHAIRG